jgi:hypothetical protein
MAAADRDTSLGLRLSSEVIRQELSLDEAILKAHSGGALEDFATGLNLFSGGEHFHLSEIEARLHSGDAQRAVEGRLPPWELPPQLLLSGGEASEAAAVSMNGFLDDLEEKIEDLAAGIEDRVQRLELLRIRQENRPSPPKPWVSGSIILGFSMAMAGAAVFTLSTLFAPLAIFLAGGGLAGVVFAQEMNRYRRFLDKQREEWQMLENKKKLIEREISDVKSQIESFRLTGQRRLERTSIFSQEQKDSIAAGHPIIFD